MQFFLTLFIYLATASVLVGTPVAAYNFFLADMVNYRSDQKQERPVPPKIQTFLERKAIPVPVQEPLPTSSLAPAPVPLAPPVRAEFVPQDETKRQATRDREPKRKARAKPKSQPAITDTSAQAKQSQPVAEQADPAPPRDLRLMTRMDRAGN